MKKVYACFCTDVIHEGHLNILREARKLGNVTVGVLSDQAVIRYNRFFTLDFAERFNLVKRLEGVDDVIEQKDIYYDDVINELKPDYVIHGDNWKCGPLKIIRDNVERLLKEYGGEIIDVPYTVSEEVRRIDSRMKEKLAMPEYRRKRLRKLIGLCPIVKALEVHSGLTGLIAEKTKKDSTSLTLCGSAPCVIPRQKENRIRNWWI